MRIQGVLVGGGALLALAGAALLWGPGSASGQAGATLSIAPASQNVAKDASTIYVDVKAENVSNLGAYELTITFDPAIVEYVGSKDSGYLASTGRGQECVGFGLSASNINTWKALHVGCNTNGIVLANTGTSGPSGSATLATIAFKPKSLGTADLVFVGRGTETYYIGAPDPTSSEGAVELGHTALTAVEVCPTGEALSCYTDDLAFTDNTAVIGIIDPQAATPTALPPTSTPKPRKTVAQSDFEATVAAAVGTPRVLGTPNVSGTPGTGTVAGESGTTGGSGSSGGTGTGQGTGVGASGLPAGVTIGPDGIPRGPDGVPIAGYGPQPQETNAWWMRSGLALLVAGAFIATLGVSRRRTAGRDV